MPILYIGTDELNNIDTVRKGSSTYLCKNLKNTCYDWMTKIKNIMHGTLVVLNNFYY